MSPDRFPLLIDPAGYREVEHHFARLLKAPSLFVLQGEAMIALESAARGIGRPGVHALNLVTGPYGEIFGQWLAQQGAEVENLVVPFSRSVSPEEVGTVLSSGPPFDVVSVVHAEAATGVVNDLAAIAALAHDADALTVVDAVASVGAEVLDIEGWGLDVTVVSAQKALSGPAGVTGLAISEAGWQAMSSNPGAPRNSVLSLLDWRERWLTSDHNALPAIPNHLETLALGAALAHVEEEGLDGVIARHRSARDACRRGVRALGLALWVDGDAEAASVATTIAVPEGVAADQLASAARAAVQGGLTPAITVAPGPLSTRALRVGHTGARATTADVLSAVAALGVGLAALGVACDLEAAMAAVLADG
jgi:aspartate aminotransferase-like enzyme